MPRKKINPLLDRAGHYDPMKLVNPFMSFGAFNPLSIAGCKLWLKADVLTLNDGDAVSTWTDSSANLTDATQTGTNRPTFKTNIVNGKPVCRFASASAQRMLWSSSTYNGISIFVVATAATNTGGCLVGNSTTNIQFRQGQSTDKLSTYDNVGNNPQSSTLGVALTAAFSVLEFLKSGT